jgi:peptidyl-prolyl cis-trans isomerase D
MSHCFWENAMLDFIRDRAKSFTVKLIFGIIIIVFVFWGVGSFDRAPVGALAVVNGEKITLQEFNKLFRREVEEQRKAAPDVISDPAKFKTLKEQVLAQVIMSRLRRQEAARLGLIVTPHELKLVLASFPVFQNAEGKFDPDAYTRVLASQGMSQGEFEADYSNILLEEKLLRTVAMSAEASEAEARTIYAFSLEKRKAEYVLFSAADYAKKAVVTDEEVQQYYTENAASLQKPAMVNLEFLRLTPESLASGYPVTDREAEEYYSQNKARFFQPESFQARHIFIACPPDDAGIPGVEEKVKQARAAIDEIGAQLAKGGDFAAIAAARSEDKESAAVGGMLGWLHKGEVGSEAFDDAALRLAPGEIGKPVRSGAGFHIIKLEGKKDAVTLPLAGVKQEVVAAVSREKAGDDFKNVEKAAEDGLNLNMPFAELAKKFHVTPEATGLAPRSEAERMLALRQDSGRILAEAIDDALAARQGKDGEAAAAVTLPVPLNVEDGIALIRIADARPSSVPPLEEARGAILERLTLRKGTDLARAAATEALPLFAGKTVPEHYANMLKESGPAIRLFPEVTPLGLMPELVNGLFSSSGEWLPEVYAGADGVVIARTKTVEPVTEDDWRQVKEIFISQLKQRRQKEALDAFMQKLLESAKIEESPDALDSLSLR